MISNLSPEDIQGEILGIRQSIQSLAQAIPPIIASLLANYFSFKAPFILAFIVIILAWVILIKFYPKKHIPA